MSRRPKGEGSLYYSDQHEKWIGQITLPTGKKKTKYGKTQGEVKKWLLDQRKAIQDGNYTTNDTLTVEQFLAKYIEDVGNHTLSPRTLISYNYLIRKHIVPDLGNLRLSRLRPDHLQGLYTAKLKQGLSRRSVQYIHQFLHTALRVAYKWGLVVRNVAELAEPPASSRKTPVILTADQANKLLSAVKEDRLYPLYVCAVSLGIREGELLALTWDDVDLKNRTLRVSKQLQYIPGQGLKIQPPKTNASIRTLPLPDVAYDALLAAKSNTTGDLLFTTSKGTPFAPRNILRHFHETLDEIDIPRMPFHNLRHSCASFHLAVGTNPRVVQALLGHSSVGITLSTYSHLLPGVKEDATKNINKIFT